MVALVLLLGQLCVSNLINQMSNHIAVIKNKFFSCF